MKNDENQFCTFLWEKKGILLLVSFLPTTQVRFFNILILLFYFKWCWASDGAANDRVSKERGCAKIIEKIPFFFFVNMTTKRTDTRQNKWKLMK